MPISNPYYNVAIRKNDLAQTLVQTIHCWVATEAKASTIASELNQALAQLGVDAFAYVVRPK